MLEKEVGKLLIGIKWLRIAATGAFVNKIMDQWFARKVFFTAL
jgi:hypothetical protein